MPGKTSSKSSHHSGRSYTTSGNGQGSHRASEGGSRIQEWASSKDPAEQFRVTGDRTGRDDRKLVEQWNRQWQEASRR